MSEGLEALERIKSHYNDRVCIDILEDFDLIETALKEGEMEHTLRVRLENINYELVREKQENEKKLKALEIISKAYGDYANHKISEYELIMTVGENTTY